MSKQILSLQISLECYSAFAKEIYVLNAHCMKIPTQRNQVVSVASLVQGTRHGRNGFKRVDLLTRGSFEGRAPTQRGPWVVPRKWLYADHQAAGLWGMHML